MTFQFVLKMWDKDTFWTLWSSSILKTILVIGTCHVLDAAMLVLSQAQLARPSRPPCSTSFTRKTMMVNRFLPLHFTCISSLATQAHSKYMQHRYCVPYCMFCCSFKVKHPVSGAKTWVQRDPETLLLRWYRNVLLCLYYAASGTYCGGSWSKYPRSVAKS